MIPKRCKLERKFKFYSLVSSGGQGKYMQHDSLPWSLREATTSIFNFSFFVKNNFLKTDKNKGDCYKYQIINQISRSHDNGMTERNLALPICTMFI